MLIRTQNLGSVAYSPLGDAAFWQFTSILFAILRSHGLYIFEIFDILNCQSESGRNRLTRFLNYYLVLELWRRQSRDVRGWRWIICWSWIHPLANCQWNDFIIGVMWWNFASTLLLPLVVFDMPFPWNSLRHHSTQWNYIEYIGSVGSGLVFAWSVLMWIVLTCYCIA